MSNGGFEKGLNEDGEPTGWHTKLTSIIPEPEYTDPENKKGRTGVVHFKCGCGHDWGTVRPWTMLVCPRCRHTNTGLEDSGALYLKNHEYVQVVPGKRGKAIRVTLSRAVGNSQGVRVISQLLNAEPDAGYEIAFDAISTGPHLRVFVEGFREMDGAKHTREWVSTLPPEANPLEQRYRLSRATHQISVHRMIEFAHIALLDVQQALSVSGAIGKVRSARIRRCRPCDP